MPKNNGIVDWEKQRERAQEAIKKASEKTDNKVLKSIVEKDEYEEDPKRRENCDIAREIFEESMSLYREGDLSFKEMIEDLKEALDEIEVDDEEKDYDEDEDEDIDEEEDEDY